MGELREMIPFPRFRPKVNVIAHLVFELTYNDVTVHHVSNFDTGTPPAMEYIYIYIYIYIYREREREK